MRKLNITEMENLDAGMSLGCGVAWIGLELGVAGLVVAGAASAGAGWALGGYLLSIVDVGVSC